MKRLMKNKNERNEILRRNSKTHIQLITTHKSGITLIALVVTIVVLLILAAITITMVLGDNGILKIAKEAGEKTNQAVEDEQEGMSILEAQINSVVNNEVYAPEGSLLAMYRQAVKDNCDNADGSCTREDHLHIGDYVDYQEPTTGSYEVTTEKSGMDAVQTYTLSATKNNVNWRVLGIDSATGGVKLIAADPIQAGNADGSAPYLKLYDAESYVYGPTEMDNICAMYKDKQYATKARSINMDDIDQITGVMTMEQKKATNYWVLDGNSQIGTSYTTTSGYYYTPENWLKRKAGDTSITATNLSGIVSGYAYPIFKTEEEANQMTSEFEENYTAVVLPNIRIYNMLFELGMGKAYWLSSRGVIAGDSEGDVAFGPGVVLNDEWTIATNCSAWYSWRNESFYYPLAVRPVVILKANVLVENVGKLADQPSTWPGVNTVD